VPRERDAGARKVRFELLLLCAHLQGQVGALLLVQIVTSTAVEQPGDRFPNDEVPQGHPESPAGYGLV
jgi:hypothetical protein